MVAVVRHRAFRHFFIMIFALLVLVAIGTAGYRLLEGMETLDAVYMTVITISTVGYGEIKPLSPMGRLFTIGLIVSGGGIAAYTFSSTATFFLSGEWRSHLEHTKRIRMLAQLSNHVIVCGYGRVGRNVAQELKAEGLPFIVIDPNPEKIAGIQEDGFLALHGNASNEQHLKEAGIKRSRGLVAAANSDAENVFIVLTARSMRKDMLIVARANYEESEPKLIRAGADRLILPYRIAGHRMVTMLVRPDVANFLDEISHATGLELLLEQVHLKPTSPLVGKTLAQVQLRGKLGITVLACKPLGEKPDTRPGPDTILQADAQIIALGTRNQLRELEKLAGI